MTVIEGADEILARKQRLREEAINALMEQAKARGEFAERAFWSMIYDFERAPTTTNRRQLAELGVEVPPSSTIDDATLTAQLHDIINGLALMHIYLIHTDHLSDRALYERLEKEILEEEVRDTPPIDGAQEWIDLCTDADEEDELAESDAEEVRADDSGDGSEGEAGDVGGVATATKRPFDRDRHLPRPPNFVAW
ncbi:MAG: hypothetical protein SGJ11_13405 [Phycisphaerae bacterium]|nr:hypothetical protein [Phycisphaerae bacterium]